MRSKRSIFWEIDKETLERVVKESTTFSEIFIYFGRINKGASYKTLISRLNVDNIDYSHILSKRGGWNKGVKNLGSTKKPLPEILTERSTYSRGHLKKRLIEDGIMENKCENCGLPPEWDGKKLVMVLDHINGISDDNRIDNLRLLCPNCNSQTETFSGRKHKKELTKCSNCSKPITGNGKTGLCTSCSSKKYNKRKVEIRPNEFELRNLLKEKTWTSIGNIYGVSDNTIRNWAREHGIIS